MRLSVDNFKSHQLLHIRAFLRINLLTAQPHLIQEIELNTIHEFIPINVLQKLFIYLTSISQLMCYPRACLWNYVPTALHHSIWRTQNWSPQGPYSYSMTSPAIVSLSGLCPVNKISPCLYCIICYRCLILEQLVSTFVSNGTLDYQLLLLSLCINHFVFYIVLNTINWCVLFIIPCDWSYLSILRILSVL